MHNDLDRPLRFKHGVNVSLHSDLQVSYKLTTVCASNVIGVDYKILLFLFITMRCAAETGVILLGMFLNFGFKVVDYLF